MSSRRRRQGFTLLEVIVATSVMLIVLAGLVYAASAFPRQARIIGARTDTQERLRLARGMLSAELSSAGFGWRREGVNGGVNTGTFGNAGGDTATNFPLRPVVSNYATGGDAGTDTLTIVLPVDITNSVLGVSAVSGNCTDGASRTFTTIGNPSTWSGGVVLLGNTNVAFLGTVTGTTATTFTMAVNECGTGATNGGVASGSNFPAASTAVRVKHVSYRVAGGMLQRAEKTDGSALVAGNWQNIVDGIEDLQIRYVTTVVPLSGAATVGERLCNSGTLAASFPHADAATCGGASMRRTPIAGTDAVRFSGVEVGLGARSLATVPGHRGNRAALFDRTAGATDNLIHRQEVWRVALPNAVGF